MPGLLGNGLFVDRDLDLSGSRIEGTYKTSASTSKSAAVWLCESRIGGRMLCVDTKITAPGQRAIQADRMHVAGTVRLLHDFEARGEIRLLGARIDGSLDLTGAQLRDPLDGLALDLGDAEIGGSLFLIPSQSGRPPTVQGRIDMGSTRIGGQLLCRSLRVEAQRSDVSGSGYSTLRRGGSAISAPRLSVGADVTFESNCEINGGIDMTLSEVGDIWIDGSARLLAPNATALDLTNATVSGSLTCIAGFTAQGTLRLTGAHVRGRLTLVGTTWTDPGGAMVINAPSATVNGDLDFHSMRVLGGAVNFRSAAIGGIVDLEAADLVNPDGFCTLSLHRASVKGSVRLVDGFRSDGLVMLSRATIDGRLDLRGGTFSGPQRLHHRNPAGDAVHAMSASIPGGVSLGWKSVSPSVDLTGASTTALGDHPGTWPSQFGISGLTFDRFEDPDNSGDADLWDWRARVAWLQRQRDFDSSPYEQVASVFRQHGYGLEAERILMAQRRDAQRADRKRRRGQGWHRQVEGRVRDIWDLLLRLLVGYGYRPSRVIWILGALTILVALSLRLPLATMDMRAVDPQGTVYTVNGPLVPAAAAEPDTSATATVRGDACGDGAVRCFNASFFAIDTVIPLLSLGQRTAWYPDERQPHGTVLSWWLNVSTVLGWLLTSIFVLSFTRLARSSP